MITKDTVDFLLRKGTSFTEERDSRHGNVRFCSFSQRACQ